MRGLVQAVVSGFITLTVLFIVNDAQGNPRNHYQFCEGDQQCMVNQAAAKRSWEYTRIDRTIKNHCSNLYIGRTEKTQDYYNALLCARRASEIDLMLNVLQSNGYTITRR